MSDCSDISRKPPHDPPTRWLCTTKDCTGLALYGDKELQPGEVRTGPATKCYTHRPGQHPYELAVVHEAPPRPTGDDHRAIRRWLVISDMAAQHARNMHQALPRPAATHRLCEPTGHEGCMVPLEEGGWADYTCTMLADKAGLCGKHYAAKRRYLVRNGLPTRMDEAA
jgi:hypothetical protein